MVKSIKNFFSGYFDKLGSKLSGGAVVLILSIVAIYFVVLLIEAFPMATLFVVLFCIVAHFIGHVLEEWTTG